jgi:hypothetical protein
LIAEGRKARDTGKFNRFRFVVQADNAPEAGKELLRAFEGLAAKDEKTHVQVISREAAPDFFESRGR